MLPKINNLNKNILLIAYKILHDLLFIVLIFFFLAQISEGLLPGIVSTHISLLKIIIFIALNISAIFILANLTGIQIQSNDFNKKTAFFLLFILGFLIFNSLWKLNLFLNLFILVFVFASVYFVYKIIAEDSKKL